MVGSTPRVIVPTPCVGMQPEPLSCSGRRSVPDWVSTQRVGTINVSSEHRVISPRSHALRGNAVLDALRPV